MNGMNEQNKKDATHYARMEERNQRDVAHYVRMEADAQMLEDHN